MKLKLDHVALKCADIEKVKSFFTDIIGLTVGYRPPFSFPGYWLYAEQNALIHLFGRNSFYHGNETNSQSAGRSNNTLFDHLAFQGDDYKRSMDRIIDNEVNFSETTVPASNIRQVFIQGPENLIVEMDFKV